MKIPNWANILNQLNYSGVPIPISQNDGNTSSTWKLCNDDMDIFIKTCPVNLYEIYSAEVDGLLEISKTNSIRVPEVIGFGKTETESYLALEWIDIESPSHAIEVSFGEQLAELHRMTSENFGWFRNNSIGLTPQINNYSNDWVNFFRENRLQYQLKLAYDNGYSGKLQQLGSMLIKKLPLFFDSSKIESSLLHGDLWAGNWGSYMESPIIFDPAVYFGDRETDLAMTMLFGGLGRFFYEAYESCWPLRQGYQKRLKIYQLYHVLNHLNIFGTTYLKHAINLLEEILQGP
ncbi:MAG: hypothetical protein CMO97_04150 [Woeseia sp.]|nr:hypothetical protein [Woeseia sp.]|tara:strand:+ start:9656 stop:10525 length:870 start_codon:yes stop_codon:yes gene_type:complete